MHYGLFQVTDETSSLTMRMGKPPTLIHINRLGPVIMELR